MRSARGAPPELKAKAPRRGAVQEIARKRHGRPLVMRGDLTPEEERTALSLLAWAAALSR